MTFLALTLCYAKVIKDQDIQIYTYYFFATGGGSCLVLLELVSVGIGSQWWWTQTLLKDTGSWWQSPVGELLLSITQASGTLDTLCTWRGTTGTTNCNWHLEHLKRHNWHNQLQLTLCTLEEAHLAIPITPSLWNWHNWTLTALQALVAQPWHCTEIFWPTQHIAKQHNEHHHGQLPLSTS